MANRIVVVKEYEDGDLFIELPEKVLKELDWNPGDTLSWTLGDDGSVIVKRQYRNEPKQPDIFGGQHGF